MAVRYALGRWEALLCFCGDGRIEIDNNAAEPALRVMALGRKNFLFAGSDGGGESAAAIYSLVGSAKLNGMALIPKAIYGTCCPVLRIIRSSASRSCYLGTSRQV
jgi:hypothetical protein